MVICRLPHGTGPFSQYTPEKRNKAMTEQPESVHTTWHDRIFKEFFLRFLPQFMRLFFPEEASHLNFDVLRFLDKELVINLPE